MDLRFEAAASSELADNFVGDDGFKVPAVDWTRTSRRVLTTERVSGIPIDERDRLIEEGHDPLAVLTIAARAFFQQVFRDGFFHADLHPGNLFVRADGGLTAVDFGIMGRVDRKTRRHLGELLLAFLSRNYRRAAEVHFEAGWIPENQSVDSFAQACRSIAEPILDKPQNEISVARLLGQLFQVTETFAMETQPQLLLLQKTMLVAEGTGRKLCPQANMWFLTRPLIQDWIAEALSPETRVKEMASEALATLARLPAVVRALEKGAVPFAQGAPSALPIRESRDPATPRAPSPGWLLWVLLAALAIVGLVS
jgi:ubiquinone biosynthesis protein